MESYTSNDDPGLEVNALQSDDTTVQKTVLITGCSSGIGRATATAFREEDWTVYATARNPADIQTLGENGCELATLDVTDDSDIDRVVNRILDEEGTIDCLVNNAGYGQFGPLEDVPTTHVHDQFAVNVYGPHRLIRAVLPHMRRERDGTIVNLSSVLGRVSAPGTGVYSGSKFALEAMSDSLRNEVRPFNVNVVVVEPGSVQTEFSDRAQIEVEGGKETDGIDRSQAYEDLYRVFEDARTIAGSDPASSAPERVADTIVSVASARNPPARVQPNFAGRTGVLARFIPDSIRDKGYELFVKFAR